MESYVITKDMSRMLIPQIIRTGVLCIIFFFAVKINLFLFAKYRIISTRPHAIVDFLIAAIIFLLFVIQVVMTYIRTIKCSYTFYPDCIGHAQWTIPYREIREPIIKQDRIDRIFKTGTVRFDAARALEHIKNPIEMRDYVLRLAAMQQHYQGYPQR